VAGQKDEVVPVTNAGLRKRYRSDPALVRACLAGRPEAWRELIDRYGRLVHSIPRRYGWSEADADDVFQIVFAILYRKLDTIRDQRQLSSWLISTTHRECYRIGKRTRRYAQLDRTVPDTAAPSDEQVAVWERQHLVREALRRLGGRCAELLTALFLAPGRPDYQAIAEQLGMKVGSIGPTRSRCFEKLQKILIEMGIDLAPEGRADEPGPESSRPLKHRDVSPVASGPSAG